MAESRNNYLWFLAISLFATFLLYLPARIISLSAVVFLVANVGNAHYLMAYLGNVRGWRTLPRKLLIRRLLLWFLATMAFIMVFYGSDLDFAWVLLFTITIAIMHVLRDYLFFYHCLTGSIPSRRPYSLAVFLISLYLSLIFLVLYQFPDKITPFFAYPLPVLMFGIFGGIGICIALLTGYYYAHQQSTKRWMYSLVFLGLPIGLLLVLPWLTFLNPFDLIYIVVLWHFVLWLTFTFTRAYYSDKTKLQAASGFFGQWQSRAQPLTVVATSAHALIFVPPLILLSLGYWGSFAELAYKSSLWGLYGYPLWSFLHIAFTTFPKYTAKSS